MHAVFPSLSAQSRLPYLKKRSRSPYSCARQHQLCRCHRVPTLSKPRGSLHQSHVVLSLVWLLCLGFPLQPPFRLLLQSVIPASIPIFFQVFWAAIVSLGRCGPMAQSQSSTSSHAGAVTRCLPVTPWVEVTSIPLAQSIATAI